MKLFLVLLLLAGGYAFGLCSMGNLALTQVEAINQTYTNVSSASDAWQAGDTSALLLGN